MSFLESLGYKLYLDYRWKRSRQRDQNANLAG